METLIYFYLWEKMDIIKKKFKFQKWKLPKCEIDDFQRDAFLGKKQEKRRERNRYPGIRTQGKAKQLQEPSKEGRKGAGSEGGKEGRKEKKKWERRMLARAALVEMRSYRWWDCTR